LIPITRPARRAAGAGLAVGDRARRLIASINWKMGAVARMAIDRPTAETTPTASESLVAERARRSPHGLADTTSAERPSGTTESVWRDGETRITPTSSKTSHRRLRRDPVVIGEPDEDPSAGFTGCSAGASPAFVITWALVDGSVRRMMKPEP
jgi:hypothetical protein